MFTRVKSFLFHNTTVRQTVAKNTFWLSVGQIGGRLLRAIIIIYAARVLGAAGWGVFSYAITLVAFLTLFVDLGINSILMRETAKTTDPAERTKIIATSLGIKVALLTAGVLVVLFVAPLFTTIESARALYPIVAFVLVFDTLREFGFSFTRAIERMEVDAILFVGTNVAIVLAGFIFLYISPTVRSFTYSYAVGTGLGMFATTFVLRRNLRNLAANFSRKLIAPIMRSAWPFAVSGLLGTLMLNTDVLIIGGMRSAEEVGLYSAATRVIQLLYTLPVILSVSILPTFSRLAHTDREKMRRMLEHAVSIAFLAAIPIALGGIAVAPALTTALFGSEYGAATLPFRILLLTILIDFPVTILSGALFAYDRQRKMIAYAAIGGILNVIFDLILIPRFGIAGSAWATFIAQAASNLYLWGAAKRVNYFTVFHRLRKIILSSVAIAIVAWFLLRVGVPVFVDVGIAGLLYLGMLRWLHEPLLEEVRLALRPTQGPAAG